MDHRLQDYEVSVLHLEKPGAENTCAGYQTETCRLAYQCQGTGAAWDMSSGSLATWREPKRSLWKERRETKKSPGGLMCHQELFLFSLLFCSHGIKVTQMGTLHRFLPHWLWHKMLSL